MTIGVERPPYGARHRKFSPFSFQLSSRPVSVELPSRLGPRISGQSPAAGPPPRGACPCTTHVVPSAAPRAASSVHFFSITRLMRGSTTCPTGYVPRDGDVYLGIVALGELGSGNGDQGSGLVPRSEEHTSELQ